LFNCFACAKPRVGKGDPFFVFRSIRLIDATAAKLHIYISMNYELYIWGNWQLVLI
jgi:hypothetical protein